MSTFSIYLIGYIIFIIGLTIGAYLLNVPANWIIVGIIVLLGLGILTGAKRTKSKDPSGE